MSVDKRKLNLLGEALEVSWTFGDKISCCLLDAQKVTRQCQKNWDGEYSQNKDTKSFFVSSQDLVFLLPLDRSFHCIVNSGKTINLEKRHTKQWTSDFNCFPLWQSNSNLHSNCAVFNFFWDQSLKVFRSRKRTEKWDSMKHNCACPPPSLPFIVAWIFNLYVSCMNRMLNFFLWRIYPIVWEQKGAGTSTGNKWRFMVSFLSVVT